MTAEIWATLHVQSRQAVCNYACVAERFAKLEWEDIPKHVRMCIDAMFVKTPFSQPFHREA